MEISYKRELNHNYLIIETEKEVEVNGYEIKMIKENSLSCFLIITTRYVDMKLAIYYEISSKQSMQRIYENRELGYEMLKNFLIYFHKMLLITEEYLINSNHLIIDPEYIYMNIETNEIALIYYPNYEEDAKEAFQKLAEYILNKVNHQDEKAVFLAYKIYKNTRNKNFILEEILNLSKLEDVKISGKNEYDYMEFKQVPKEESSSLFNEINYSKKETIVAEENKNWNQGMEDILNENVDSILKKDTEKEIDNKIKSKSIKKFYGISTVFSIILGILVYLKISNLLPENISYHQFLIIMGTMAMIITGSILNIYLDIKRNKIRQETKKENNYNEWEEVEKENKKIQNSKSESEILKKGDIKLNIEEEKSDMIQIYDFLSSNSENINQIDKSNNALIDTEAEEQGMYGNTVLLGSVCDASEKQILRGMIKGKEVIYQIDHFPFTVGKLAECVDLELKDTSISRMHARFFKREGKVYLEDLNSTNGTFKNGMRLEANETVKVEVEDEISFAKLVFVYH